MREHSTVGIILIVFMKTAKRNLQAVPMVKEFIELFNQSQKYHYTPKRRNTPTPVPRKYNGNSYSSWKSDSYDVSNYDDPDDFADDWADEFGDGDYDGGYDDAYDYWEENGN